MVILMQAPELFALCSRGRDDHVRLHARAVRQQHRRRGETLYGADRAHPPGPDVPDDADVLQGHVTLGAQAGLQPFRRAVDAVRPEVRHLHPGHGGGQRVELASADGSVDDILVGLGLAFMVVPLHGNGRQGQCDPGREGP